VEHITDRKTFEECMELVDRFSLPLLKELKLSNQ